VGSGLGFYGVYRVESSSWAEAMHELAIRRQPGEKHRPASPPPKPGLTHYIVTMHDSTFECIASGLTFEVRRQALDDVVAHLAGDLRSA
jgi:hypothetical protein